MLIIADNDDRWHSPQLLLPPAMTTSYSTGYSRWQRFTVANRLVVLLLCSHWAILRRGIFVSTIIAAAPSSASSARLSDAYSSSATTLYSIPLIMTYESSFLKLLGRLILKAHGHPRYLPLYSISLVFSSMMPMKIHSFAGPTSQIDGAKGGCTHSTYRTKMPTKMYCEMSHKIVEAILNSLAIFRSSRIRLIWLPLLKWLSL